MVSLYGGHYVNVLGWEAAKAPYRYRFDRTILIGNNFYGAAYNEGAGLFVTPQEGISLKFFVQDYVFGDVDRHLRPIHSVILPMPQWILKGMAM